MINTFRKLTKHSKTWLYVFLALLCITPILFFAAIMINNDSNLYMIIGLFLMTLSLFFIPFLFFRKKTAFIINSIYIFLSIFELYSLYLYKLPFSSSLAFVLFQTNKFEAIEFLQSNLPWLFIYLFICGAYLFLVIKYVENEFLFSKKYKKIILLSTIAIYIGMFAYCLNLNKSFIQKHESKLFWSHSLHCYSLKFKKIYPVNIFYGFSAGIKNYSDLKIFNSNIDTFTFNATTKEKINEREIYVFIIGETARASNFSINGYHRNTTPLLKNTKNIYSYTDVLSQASLTTISLPILLTRSDAINFELYKKEKTVVDAFKEAGFNTYWIGNQSFYNNFIVSICNRVDNAYMTLKDFDYTGSLDETMFPFLNEILNKKEQKQFIVIHTLGSHFRYNLRYSSEYRKFEPDLSGLKDYQQILNPKNKEQLLNSYDNSIAYTDYFLTNTISLLEKEQAISYLFYISDHGENIYDDDNLFGHGSTKPTKNELHVPLILWLSDRYIETFPHKENSIKRNINKKKSSEIVFHSLIDMGNIDMNNLDIDKSISDTLLTSDSVRYFRNIEGEIIEIKY